jgi:RNA polymerase sigma-70 factor (ECF subfamily)
MRPHFDALYGAASRIAASASDVEDLVQDVCLKAYLRLDELELIEHQRAWLLRVLHNLFIDRQRKNQRSPLALTRGATNDETTEFVASKQYQPDEQVERMMQRDNILGAMKLLDREQCVLLVLHEVDGYGLQELQSLTGLPLGTLKSKLHRTRVKLGRLLRKRRDQISESQHCR